MKRRLLPLCTALVLCLLLAPAAWAAVYPTLPLKPCISAVTTGRKSKRYLLPGPWRNRHHSGCQRRQLQYLLQGRDAHPARGRRCRITSLYLERPPSTWWEKTPLARKTPPPTWASKASPPGPSPSLAQAPAPFTAAQKASSRYNPTAPQTPK